MSPLKTLLLGGLMFIGSVVLFFTGRLAANLGSASSTALIWASLAMLIGSLGFLILYIRKVKLK